VGAILELWIIPEEQEKVIVMCLYQNPTVWLVAP